MSKMTPIVPLRRLAVELVGGNAGQPDAMVGEDIFDQMLDLVTRSPEIAAIDLGILQDATKHPAFPVLLQRAADRLSGRSGTILLWVAASGLRELPLIPAEATIAFGLVPGAPAGALSILMTRFAQAGAVSADDRQIAEVPLGVRPDRKFRKAGALPRGGCPILEQGALFMGVEGAVHACQRHLAAGAPIAHDLSAIGPSAPDALARMRHFLRLDKRSEASPICAACPLGLTGLKGENVNDYWALRDEEAPIEMLQERVHLFRESAPAPNRAVRVDLGCGAAKTPGFVGVDRFPIQGVDMLCDIDKGIPFADDSVDYVIASHALEHIADLPGTIQEIFRICRDRAIVTIISPYHATGLNRANPYHKQVFNEHTARFFTTHPSTPRIPAEDYDFPHATVWGLGSSDHSDWRADLRPLHTEYFYFPPYRALDPESKRWLRAHLSDVCDQMVTHLLVVKTPISDEEFERIAQTAPFQETNSLRMRRALEQQHGAPDFVAALPALPDRVAVLEAQVAPQLERLDPLSSRQEALEKQLVNVEATRAQNAVAQGETSAVLAALSERHGALEKQLASVETARAQNAAAQGETSAVLAAVSERQAALERQVQGFETAREETAAARREMSAALARISERQADLEGAVKSAEALSSTHLRQLTDHLTELQTKVRRGELYCSMQDKQLFSRLVGLEKTIGRSLSELEATIARGDALYSTFPARHDALEVQLVNGEAARREISVMLNALSERHNALEVQVVNVETARQTNAAAQREISAVLAAVSERQAELEGTVARGEALSEALSSSHAEQLGQVGIRMALIWKLITPIRLAARLMRKLNLLR